MARRLINNEHELFVVLFVLLCKLAEAGKKGNVAVFPPDKIILPAGWIQDKKWFSDKPRQSLKIAKKDINFSFETETRNDIGMPQAIRRLGVTLYHLVAGKSELTHESFLIDGYRAPFDGADWPLILAMIRGEIESPKVAFKLFRSRQDNAENSSDGKNADTETKKEPHIISPYINLIDDWRNNFYRDIFGITPDFSNLVIPEKPKEGDWRLLIIIDLLLETLYAKCKSLFPCWRWTNKNLDEIVIENERTAKDGPYAIWVRDNLEADIELKNLSADDIKRQNVTTETLAEGFIHVLKVFVEIKKHLDIENVTLYAGSRYSDGIVSRVHWRDGQMRVHWYGPGHALGHMRARETVS